jgi:release factor glutamine methyltransferase
VTASAALAAGAARLGGAGIPEAQMDAELLLRHVLGWSRADLIARENDPLPASREASFLHLIAERAARRPLQHLIGTAHFWRHEFMVTPDVLVPRPETELLVELALARLRGRARPTVVDVGTGSGCIALSLAEERPDAIVHAVDLSAPALRVARENARRLGLESRVTLHEGDLLAPVAHLAHAVDLVVSNPPYVDSAELPLLPPEVRDHEPRGALLAPDAPYGIYGRLLQQAAGLAPGAELLLEVGRGMGERVGQLCREAGLILEGIHPDLAGISRVVHARK